MTHLAKNTKATIIPALRYPDAPAAIEWLCKAFGFEKHLMFPLRMPASRMPNAVSAAG